MSATQQQVVTLLENVLFETPTQATANAGTWINNSAASSVQSLATAMANSGEAKIAATVVGYYLASLGRAPNAAEVQYYVAIAEQGLTQTQIAAGQVSSATWDTIGSYFAHSPEFASRGNIDFSLGNTAAYLEAVPWLYESVLGRTPNSAELAYYDAQVVNGTDLGTLFREFTASPEFHTDTDAQIATALANFGTSTVAGNQPPAVAATVTLGTPTPPPTTSPPTSAPTPTPTFGAFTVSTDNIQDASMTGAHTYTATYGGTLAAGDTLVGNGLAELDVTDTGVGSAVTSLPGTLSGLASLHLTSSEDIGSIGVAFDLTAVASVTSAVLNASGTSGDFVHGASTIDITASTASSLFSLVSGAHSLDLTDDALTSLNISGTITNGITLHDAAAPTSLTTHFNASLGVAITDAANQITTLTIDGSTASTIASVTDTALATLQTGAGTQNVTFGTDASTRFSLGTAVTTINLATDSTAATGNFFLVGTDNATFTLGSQNINDIDLNSHAGTTLVVAVEASYSAGSPVANLVLSNPAGTTTLDFGLGVSLSPDGLSPGDLNTLLVDFYGGATPAAGDAMWANISNGSGGFDTYIVESATGTGAGSSDTTIIKIVGGAALTATGNHITF